MESNQEGICIVRENVKWRDLEPSECPSGGPQDVSYPVDKMVASDAVSFKSKATAFLPIHVLECAFSFLPLAENGVLCVVSKEFREAAEDDSLWRDAYTKWFKREDSDGNAHDSARRISLHRNKPPRKGSSSLKRAYMKRIVDPQMGDMVEVSWKGKFRLESLDVYDGVAWWVAEVVRKDSEPGFYQVHYPGWESRWDEWVPRERLRWGNERRTLALKGISPSQGDLVEMWCEGAHVPGAWLEAVVHAVADDRLQLREVLTPGRFWVDADNVRLVKISRESTHSALTDGAGAVSCCASWYRRIFRTIFGCLGLRVGTSGARRSWW